MGMCPKRKLVGYGEEEILGMVNPIIEKYYQCEIAYNEVTLRDPEQDAVILFYEWKEKGEFWHSYFFLKGKDLYLIDLHKIAHSKRRFASLKYDPIEVELIQKAGALDDIN